MPYYLITEYCKDKKVSLIILYFVFVLLLTFIISLITGYLQNSSHFTTAHDPYYENPVIRKIYCIYLTCIIIVTLVFVCKILIELKIINFKIHKGIEIILLLLPSLLILGLTWYEFYFSGTFDYSNRDKQQLSLNLIWPSICLAMFATVLLADKLKYNGFLFVIFIGLSYVFNKIQHSILLKYSGVWNMYNL